jgi:hypothetical protein
MPLSWNSWYPGSLRVMAGWTQVDIASLPKNPRSTSTCVSFCSVLLSCLLPLLFCYCFFPPLVFDWKFLLRTADLTFP